MDRKIVVIGGMGLLGSAIVRHLLPTAKVIVGDRRYSQALADARFGQGVVDYCHIDITERCTLYRALKGVEGVYNLAGALGTSELERDKVGAIQTNVVGAVNVFEVAQEMDCQYVFYPSKPNVWLNTYTITKYASEQFAKLFNQDDDFAVCSLRYFNAYGPGQHLYPIRKIVPTFAIQAMRGLPIQVYGDGEQTVDMIYTDDIAKITVDFTETRCKTVLDLGRGIEVTVNQVAEDVNEFFGNKAGIQHLPMRVGETPNTKLVADISQLKELIPLEFSDWKTSLATTLEYYAKLPESEIERALAFYGMGSGNQAGL